MDGMPGGSSGAAGAAGAAAESPLARGARRRKAWFPDTATARANYASKPPLNGFRADALDAYVEHGFRPATSPDGVEGAEGVEGVELKCAPEVEASIFEMGGGHGGFARLGEVACPVPVVASGDGAPPAMAAGLVAEALPDGRLVTMPELTHFGPMEDPEAVASALAADLLD
jgi:pimeloyl-ACP methyl ester carboxylesterase